MMKPYELLYIVPAVMTDAEAETVNAKVTEMVKATGAQIIRVENLGKIKLAYPIKHQKYGFYMLVQFDAEAEVISKLEYDLRLNENILRHQLIARGEGADKKAYKLEAYQSPISEEGFAPRRGASAPMTAAPIIKKGPEMTIEELDKKLDAILEGTNENV